uniref:Serine protease inhibitor n=1 Tax=Stenopsyche marmorata TaxID=177930 RepID=A0A2Z6FL73_9NEOP|nr:serine protease inhibitor [Stenopsyche marmorata]
MARILPIAVLFLCIVAAHGKPGKYLRKALEFKRSIETFSMKLLNESVTSANDNFIESPISVWNMLTVLAEGANGNTLKQLKSIAHNNVEQAFVKKAFHNVTHALLVNTTTIKLQSVNAMFLPSTTKIDQNYRNSIRKNFLTKIFWIDFEQEDPTKRVNRFVEKNTGGNIKDFLTNDVPQDANMILINAIHFKGQWTVPFNPEDTMRDFFYDKNNEVIGEANYMHGIGKYNFMTMKKINAQILEIPYGVEGRLSMIVVLPIPANSFRTVIYQISKVGMANIINLLSESSVDEFRILHPSI